MPRCYFVLPKNTTFPLGEKGLLAGKKPMHGFVVSHAENKTKKTWYPHVTTAQLYSHILGARIRFTVSTAALRWIKKAGGLDNYLLKTPTAKLASDTALMWRAKLLWVKDLQEQQEKKGNAEWRPTIQEPEEKTELSLRAKAIEMYLASDSAAAAAAGARGAATTLAEMKERSKQLEKEELARKRAESVEAARKLAEENGWPYPHPLTVSQRFLPVLGSSLEETHRILGPDGLPQKLPKVVNRLDPKSKKKVFCKHTKAYSMGRLGL